MPLDDRQRLMLEMKRKAGLASRAEIEILNSAWRVVGGQNGGCCIIVGPQLTLSDWYERHKDDRYIPLLPSPVS